MAYIMDLVVQVERLGQVVPAVRVEHPAHQVQVELQVLLSGV